MASKKHGVKPTEWWKHLRKEKRPNNKRVRRDGLKQAKRVGANEEESE